MFEGNKVVDHNMFEAIVLDIKDIIENGLYFVMIKMFEAVGMIFIALLD